MTVVVVIGGVPEHQMRPSSAELGEVSAVIAADSGWDLATDLGFDVDLLIGDLDSISAEGLIAAEQSRARIERYPTTKDATDLELALDAAMRHVGEPTGGLADRVVVIGGEGGRFDHVVANLVVMASPRYRGVTMEGWLGGAYVAVVDRRWSRSLRAGVLLTVVPWGGPSEVRLVGVRWPLLGEVLADGTTRGVSNEATGGPVDMDVGSGVVLLVIPDGLVVPDEGELT